MIDKLINLKLADVINISQYLEILYDTWRYLMSFMLTASQTYIQGSSILCCAGGNWKRLYEHFEMRGFVTLM